MISDQKATFLVRPTPESQIVTIKVTIMLAVSNQSKMRNATRVRPTRPLPQHSKLKSQSSKKIRNDTTLDQTTCLTGRVQVHYTTLPTIYYAHYCINSEVYMDFKKQLCVELRLRTKEDEVPVHIIFLSQFSANTLWGLPCYSRKILFRPLLCHLNAISFLSFIFRHHAA